MIKILTEFSYANKTLHFFQKRGNREQGTGNREVGED
jgi:hypothetical protein